MNEKKIQRFHEALAACAAVDQPLPSINGLDPNQADCYEDVTPPRWPLRVYINRAEAEKHAESLLDGFGGWSITYAQPQPFVNLCMFNFEVSGGGEQWTDYQADVLIAMAVAVAMEWATLIRNRNADDSVFGQLLRMKAEALSGHVTDTIQKLLDTIGPLVDKAFVDPSDS